MAATRKVTQIRLILDENENVVTAIAITMVEGTVSGMQISQPKNYSVEYADQTPTVQASMDDLKAKALAFVAAQEPIV